ncbi:MAG: hypothetical protein V7K68_02610 [Nostoc sp.]
MYESEFSDPRSRNKGEEYWLSKALISLCLTTISNKLQQGISDFGLSPSIFTICWKVRCLTARLCDRTFL